MFLDKEGVQDGGVNQRVGTGAERQLEIHSTSILTVTSLAASYVITSTWFTLSAQRMVGAT